MATPTPSIALIGAGLTGLTLTIALRTHAPHLPLTLYEAAPTFTEIGAGVGFEPYAVRTMGLINPSIQRAFEKCARGNVKNEGEGNGEEGEVPRWFQVRVGDGRKEEGGGKVFDIPAQKGSRGGVHRAHFLDELVKLVPDGVVVFGKKVVDIREADDGSGDSILHFSDLSTSRHTAVLACDGIKSLARTLVLGDTDAAKASFSGKYAYRGLIPMAKAVEIMGDADPKQSQMFCGYHGHVLTFPIVNATILNVVAFSSRPSWPDTKWVLQTSRAAMLEDYTHWRPVVVKIMANLLKPDIWALFDHPPAATYFSTTPLICLVGDAAHASTPHQGAGAGMCIEDVWILSQVLSKCRCKDDIARAFGAYDATRRARSQKLVKTSREAGMLWEYEGEGVGDDVELQERNAVGRMDWIWDYDISVDLERAMEMMSAGS